MKNKKMKEVKPNNIGETLFSDAVLNCKFNYIKLQLQTGTNVNMCNNLGQTALMKCCFIENSSQRQQMFKLLLCYGADINMVDKSGKTVLHYAALLGRCEVVDIITRNTLSLDLNALDRNGKTPLLYAVMSGNVETCRSLVKCLKHYGLTVDKTDAAGITPFITARTLGYTQIADILIYEGNANAFQSDNKFFRCADEWAFLKSSGQPKNVKQPPPAAVLPPIKHPGK